MSSAVISEALSGVSVFSGSALRVPEAKRGRVPCDGAEEVCKMHALQMQTRRSQRKAEKATAPSPSSSLYRYRAPKPCPY